MSAGTASETKRPWRFVGIDEHTAGRRSGVVMAKNEAAAVAAARLQGVIGTKVSKEASKGGTVRAKLSAGSSSERMAFLNSLALINSAVPSMAETMSIAAQQVPPRSRLRPAVEALLNATRGGGETLDRRLQRRAMCGGATSLPSLPQGSVQGISPKLFVSSQSTRSEATASAAKCVASSPNRSSA